MEPGVEAVGIADGADVDPGGRERLLDGIGRAVIASEDQRCRSVQLPERLRGKHGERVGIAVLGAHDEVSLHQTPDSGRLYCRAHH